MLFSLGSDIILHKFHMFSDIFWVIPIKIVETNHEGTKYNHKYSSKFENILKYRKLVLKNITKSSCFIKFNKRIVE